MNPFYHQNQTNPMQILQQFQQWRQGMSGNPNQILQQMMQSGKVNQDLLNRAQSMVATFQQFLK